MNLKYYKKRKKHIVEILGSFAISIKKIFAGLLGYKGARFKK